MPLLMLPLLFIIAFHYFIFAIDYFHYIFFDVTYFLSLIIVFFIRLDTPYFDIHFRRYFRLLCR